MKKRNATDSSNGYSYEKVVIHIESLRNWEKNFEIFPEEGEDFKLVINDIILYCQVKHKYKESFTKKNGAFMKHFNDNSINKNDAYIFRIHCLGFNEKQLNIFNSKNYEDLFITKLKNYDKEEIIKLLNKTEIIVEKDFIKLFEEANIIISEIISTDNKELCDIISTILLHNISYDICIKKGNVYKKENMIELINKYSSINIDKLRKIKYQFQKKEIISFYE